MQGMLLAVADQHDAAFDDIAEFLAVMRLDREALAALGQLEQYRLHLILLRVGTIQLTVQSSRSSTKKSSAWKMNWSFLSS